MIPKHLDSSHPKVTQVYCSAFSCGYSGLENDLWAPMAKLLLEATYEATLLSAITRRPPNIEGTPKVYLTFVGGGVFGNDLTWIVSSIARAVRQLRRKCDILPDKTKAELEVIICHYKAIREDVRAMINREIESDDT